MKKNDVRYFRNKQSGAVIHPGIFYRMEGILVSIVSMLDAKNIRRNES